ncbi:MAG: hypothetical protein QF489_04765 [Planctomycetota bacterium]|nr:hypothetical protein [Planctomycetota bacterium]
MSSVSQTLKVATGVADNPGWWGLSGRESSVLFLGVLLFCVIAFTNWILPAPCSLLLSLNLVARAICIMHVHGCQPSGICEIGI